MADDNSSDGATPLRSPAKSGAIKPYSDLDIRFEILAETSEFVAIDKPPGFHVHQPEDPRHRTDREFICLNNLRNQLDTYLYPVHRLDVGTEGVLIFAKTKEAAKNLSYQFQDRHVKKTYYAIVRGWTDDEGDITIPLELDSTGEPVESRTHYRTLQKVEMPYAIGKRHTGARYSLVEAKPETGRFHQIRRHMARIAHPIVGDSMHGDSHHNKYFRGTLEQPGLWLKAKVVEFNNPAELKRVRVESPWTPRWIRIFNTLGFVEPVTTSR